MFNLYPLLRNQINIQIAEETDLFEIINEVYISTKFEMSKKGINLQRWTIEVVGQYILNHSKVVNYIKMKGSYEFIDKLIEILGMKNKT
jgi:hypothetical protein